MFPEELQDVSISVERIVWRLPAPSNHSAERRNAQKKGWDGRKTDQECEGVNRAIGCTRRREQFCLDRKKGIMGMEIQMQDMNQ